MLQSDIDVLSAAATARVFSLLLWMSQQSDPVDELPDFERRSRDLLSDLEAVLGQVQSRPELRGECLARHYEALAKGRYDHDVVGTALGKALDDLDPAFAGLPQGSVSSILGWLREHGSTSHGQSWLLEQTASLLVADALPSPSAAVL